jgi:hypothetical protein
MFERRKQPWELSGDGVVRFQQKRGGRRVSLSIDKSGVDYEIKDVNGEVKFHALFEEIDPQASRIVEKNGGLFNLSIIFLVLGVASAAMNYVEVPHDYLGPLFFVLMSAVSYAVYHWRKTAFSVFITERGRMSIMEDARHDDILRELNLRRVSTLRSKYLQIDHDNSPKTEMGKYNWLRRVGAITDVELSQFTSMLQGDPDTRQRNQPPTISPN